MVDTALAALAAGRLVDLLSTDGWEAATSALPALWRHSRTDRVDADLADTRLALTGATDQDTAEQLRAQLAQEWQDRFVRLLADRPEAAQELRRLLDPPPASAPQQITLRMEVSGGDGYQAARDITIDRRGRA
ncbi:hypothetical protein ACFV4P_01330 [Kitasatospora sp. NPDC059795]|uniref:hypothetical protein n=1 Tax=Kitasatospora sp. NPDC059795 TaxID=3346949 RepID=UPI0036679EC4